jgi:hypothetical protein
MWLETITTIFQKYAVRNSDQATLQNQCDFKQALKTAELISFKRVGKDITSQQQFDSSEKCVQLVKTAT